jgi:curved DNA-binding protein CbpA
MLNQTMNDSNSLYDILELKPDASPQEVREAYLRTKAAYNKDSVALYTLISADEREEMLSRIEEAYGVLSNTDRRKDYDRNHGHLELEDDFKPAPIAAGGRKIISIDRVPPMESSADSEDLLIAPKTDFSGDGIKPLAAEARPKPQAAAESPIARKPTRSLEAALSQEIAQEVEWKGVFLRKVREFRRVSIEEMANITKVSKTYLNAIEEENFPKLPAAVFLRGFITQIAKTLKLPHEQVTSAYMARYYQARPDKNEK